MSPGRTPQEWDTAHLLPEGVTDPFTTFACNERKVAWLRAQGCPEAQVLSVRADQDRALAAYRRTLEEVMRTMTREEAGRWRDFVPQVEFWLAP